MLYVGIILVQMKRWYQMFCVTSGPFGLIQWCVLEQDFFWGGEAVVYAKLIFIFGIEK